MTITKLCTPDEYVKYKDRDEIQASDLSKKQRQELMNINKKLIEIEKVISKEFIKLNTDADKRLNDKNDWVEDYEIEAIITFYLKEDDPDYKEDDDNILVELTEYGKGERHKEKDAWGLNDGNNHNDLFEEHPMLDEHHCWLYHSLYDHTELGWSNMLRIGSIWLDIDIEYQKNFEL